MFSRLGIYKWKDVIGAAQNSIENIIMAVKFSETTMLANAVSWKVLQEILKSNNLKNNIQSPVKIPFTVFENIYRAGSKGKNGKQSYSSINKT